MTTSAGNTQDEDSWKSMPSPEKGKAKKNPARASRVVRKEKKATQAKITEKRQQSTRASMVSVEIAESTDTKPLIVGANRLPNLKVKAWHGKVEIQSERNQCK